MRQYVLHIQTGTVEGIFQGMELLQSKHDLKQVFKYVYILQDIIICHSYRRGQSGGQAAVDRE